MNFIRLIIGFAMVALVGLGAAWVADHPGWLTLDWDGWRIELPLMAAAGAVLVIFVLLVVAYRLLAGLLRLPFSWRAGWGRRNQRLAYRAFTDGMVAIAAGDARGAEAQAGRVNKLLEDPTLGLLLGAQAAQLSGDESEAMRLYGALADHDATRFLGLRGLCLLAMRRGERDRALDLARQAFSLKPDAAWPIRTLIELEAACGAWDAAAQHLELAARKKVMGAAEVKRKQGIVALERARHAADQGDAGTALDCAEKARKFAPDLIPARLFEAELLMGRGDGRKAAKRLREAWALSPHPSLARLYLDLPKPGDGAERLARAKTLTAVQPDHPESRLVLAEAALAADDVTAALSYLDGLVEHSPRVFRLKARLAERHGDGADAARRWLDRAADAVDPMWVCGDCGHAAHDWQANCPACARFDSLVWRQPAGFAPPAESARLAPPHLEERR